MRFVIPLTAAVWGLALTSLAEPVREVTIVPDPVQNGIQVFDVCLTPGETQTYDKLTFDCVLHQEFPQSTTEKRNGIQVHEPAVFTYRRNEVKMVEDLDVHVSFRVPVSIERLREIYGATTFNVNFPVSVPRMKISALVNNIVIWSFEVKAEGRHTPVFAPRPEAGVTP